ncbi:MAG: S8 family serine peptidase [Acidobacteriia bacterium]|nr:S8 family serine peptidase [Terriglobia bacterium]
MMRWNESGHETMDSPGTWQLLFNRSVALIGTVVVAVLFLAAVTRAATLSPNLQSALAGATDSTASVGVVIVAFNNPNNQTLSATQLAILNGAGITKGLMLTQLDMVAAPATVGQVKALAANAAVRSIWSNDPVTFLNNQTRVLTGVQRLQMDPNFTALHGGMPVAGQGNFSVVINDSGIDGTHSDVHFPDHVIQNVLVPTDTGTLTGFTTLTAIPNVPNTDTNSGHGSHCAGIVGGTGQDSGGLYAGVAPGAHLIGVGSGAALFILSALGGFEWSLSNQFLYNIRVISNSWGTTGEFSPDDPINIASKTAHDRNIVVVFAAGNSGPGKDTMNPYACAPWVIGAAAGTKEGGLASFSSRGIPKAERLADSDPNNDFTAPTITAPGTGREFASDSNKFTSDVVSVRASTNIFENGTSSGADAELPTAFIPFYTEISGTSMATPHTAGIVALMLSANPALSPDQIKQILQQTASQMPGFSEFEVGAGFINAYAAVDKVYNQMRTYGSFGGPKDLRSYNEAITVSGGTPQAFHIDFSPAALPGPGSPNSLNFTVNPGMDILDVFASFDTAANQGTGNTIGILLTDPNGVQYSSGLALPVLDSPSREVLVNNPAAGQWLLEVRGIRGLTALPEVRLPTSGAAAPGPVDGTITQSTLTLAPVSDIAGSPAQAEILFVLRNRIMDTFPDGTFQPDLDVTRMDFANLLTMNTALRQTLNTDVKQRPAAPVFTDVTLQQDAIAEAATANGSTLRDFDFSVAGMMSATPPLFNPTTNVARLDVAVALVRALGMDAQAQALAGTTVTANYNGQSIAVSDNSNIPSALAGYAQIALNRQILQAFFVLEQGPFDFQPTLHAYFKPADPVTRAFMAYSLDHFRQDFVAGN